MMNYSDRLKACKLPTLHYRRIRRDMIETYKIMTGKYDIEIGAVSGNGIIKINLLLHAFPVVTAKERNVISIAFRHRSVHGARWAHCRGTTGQWS